MWVARHAGGVDGPISDFTDRFVALDDSTRAAPNPAAGSVYREMQALFEATAGDLRDVFTRHRRITSG